MMVSSRFRARYFWAILRICPSGAAVQARFDRHNQTDPLPSVGSRLSHSAQDPAINAHRPDDAKRPPVAPVAATPAAKSRCPGMSGDGFRLCIYDKSGSVSHTPALGADASPRASLLAAEPNNSHHRHHKRSCCNRRGSRTHIHHSHRGQ